jgi:hypothetical protein
MTRYPIVLALLVALVGCQNSTGSQNRFASAMAVLQPIPAGSPTEPVIQQRLYVPAYSAIYFEDQRRTLDLSITLSLRNTDPLQPIRINAVQYYNPRGRLVRSYLRQPRLLPPLSTVDFIIDRNDQTGGVSPAFVVEWQADTGVSQPIAEAVMVTAMSNQGLSLLTNGRVVWEQRRSPAQGTARSPL